MNNEIMQAWEIMPQETKDRIMTMVKRLAEALIEAVQKIFSAIAEAFKQLLASGASASPALSLRIMARIEAARVKWRAKGPRRNRALFRAIMARRRGYT